MALIAQTKTGAWTDTDVGTLSSVAIGTVRGIAFGDVGKVTATGTPDGDLTAPKGWEYTDDATGIMYLNQDDATAWEAVQTAPTLASVPLTTGIKMSIISSDGIRDYISAFAATSTAGNMVAITYTQTVGQEVTAAALPISTFVIQTGATVATSGSAVIGWYQIGGLAEVSVDGSGTAILVGDFLEVLDATTALIKAGTARVLTAAAKAVDASSAAEIATVYLINEQHTVADT